MLIRAHDRPPTDDAWQSFVRAQGFGHLVAGGGPDRSLPVVVPTQFVLEDDAASIVLHLAAANPVFAAIDENPQVVLSVAGDWAYIPGQWKAIGDEDPAVGVPTTYYAAAQVEATANIVDDAEPKAAILRRQVGDLQPDGGLVDPLDHEKLFRAIRGLHLDITDVRAKFKYGGNLDAAHQDAIIDRLAVREGPGDGAALIQAQRIRAQRR